MMANDMHAATGIEDCFSITILLIGVSSGKLLHSSTWSACCSTSSIYLRVFWMVTNSNSMLLEVAACMSGSMRESSPAYVSAIQKCQL